MARKSTKRPKGYIEWTPSADVAYWLSLVVRVLREYGSYGPMTVRQIFYRLVGQYEYAKTERAYKNLAGWLVKARRAGIIPFGSIRDDGTIEHGLTVANLAGFWDDVKVFAESNWRDRLQENDYAIELWCEAGGMAPMLARMTRDWTVPVYSTGGFSSVTVVHEVAQRIIERGRPTAFLHVGDYDPSGVSIFESMAEDIGAFVAAEVGEFQDPTDFGVEFWFEPVRIALTKDQVAQYNLPTAPAKASDSRSLNWWDSTTQAEALPPDLLNDIVREAVQQYVLDEPYAQALEDEANDRIKIMADLKKVKRR